MVVIAEMAFTFRRVLSALKPHQNGIFSHLLLTTPFSSSRSIEFEIRDLCKSGFREIQDALKLFDEMLARKPPLSILNYNQLFTAIAKMKYYSTVPLLFKQMMSTSPIQPNLYTFSILINCFCRSDQSRLSFSVLAHIYRSGYHPSIVTLTTFLNGLCIDGKVPKALDLFRKMQKMGYPCTVVTYGVIINGLCKSGLVHKALELLVEMEETPWCICPNAPVYNAVIDGFCKYTCPNEGTQLFDQIKVHDNGSNGWLKRTNELLAAMIRKGKQPTTITYSTLICGYCTIGNMKTAVKIFNTMVSNDCEPRIFTYNTLIDGFCKITCPVEAQRLFDGMQIQSKGSSASKNRKLFDGLYEEKSLGVAIKLFHLIVDKGLAPNVVTYNTLMMGLTRFGQMNNARELFNQISANGLKPDVITYNTMIGGFCKEGMMEEANELFMQMEEEGNSPNEVTFKTLVRGNLQKKNEFTRQLIDKMTDRGFRSK